MSRGTAVVPCRSVRPKNHMPGTGRRRRRCRWASSSRRCRVRRSGRRTPSLATSPRDVFATRIALLTQQRAVKALICWNGHNAVGTSPRRRALTILTTAGILRDPLGDVAFVPLVAGAPRSAAQPGRRPSEGPAPRWSGEPGAPGNHVRRENGEVVVEHVGGAVLGGCAPRRPARCRGTGGSPGRRPAAGRSRPPPPAPATPGRCDARHQDSPAGEPVDPAVRCGEHLHLNGQRGASGAGGSTGPAVKGRVTRRRCRPCPRRPGRRRGRPRRPGRS